MSAAGTSATAGRPGLRPDSLSGWSDSGLAVAAVAGLLVWLTRLPFRAERLSGWDPVNFALALDRWDLALHQPHPPGYLGYVLLARLVRPLTNDANGALVLVAAAATAAAAIVLWRVAGAIGVPAAPRRAGTVAFLSSPLVWFYSSVGEVYALEMLCALLVAAACLRLRRTGSSLRPLAFAFAACALVKLPTALMLLPLAAVAAPGRRLVSLGAGLAAVAAVLLGRAIDDPAMPALFLEQFADATAGTRLTAAGDASWFRGLNRQARDVLQAVAMLGAGVVVALPYAAWRAVRARSLDGPWVAGWMAPMLAVFVFVHFAKPGYLSPLAPLAFLALMAGLAPLGRRGTATLAGIAVVGALQFLTFGPLPASITGGDLRYGDKRLLQKLTTDLEPVTFASAATIAGIDRRIDQVRRAVGERCRADGVVLVSDGGAIDWRQAMYYLPAHHVVRAMIPQEPLMVAYQREVTVHAAPDRLQSACPAIWIGDEPAAAALPDERAPIVERMLPGLWSVQGRFAAEVGGEHRLSVVPAETAPRGQGLSRAPGAAIRAAG